jgi:hypothetical protein
MCKTLILTAVLLVALVGSHEIDKRPVAAKPDDVRQFIVGVLRADGTLIPFAQYGNGGWTNPWPRPRESQGSIYDEEAQEIVPHSLGELPEPWFLQCGKTPPKWYFWASLDTPTVLKASEVVKVENHSQTNWALLTNLPKQNTDDTHHVNIGVALNVNLKVEPVMQIQPGAPEAVEILSFVRQAFDDAAKAELKTLYRSSLRLNGEYLYYVEAEKQQKRPPGSRDEGCNDITLFHGWISADEKGGMGLFDSRVFQTDCDMKGPSSSTPLGIMKLKDITYIFVTEHGWEDESYWIIGLDKSGLHKVLETYGG